MMASLASSRPDAARERILKQGYERFFTAYMLSLLENPDTVVRVAEEDGTVVGYAVATRSREQPFARYGHVALLQDVYVEEARRGSGTGRALIDAVRDWAREARLDALEVEVPPQREEEIKTLERLGFLRNRMTMLFPLKKEEAAKVGGPSSSRSGAGSRRP